MIHPLRKRWSLDGPWRLKDEPDLEALETHYVDPNYDDGDWREVPPATHLQPWLYPENPYWGEHVRRVNEAAWWYRTRFSLPAGADGRHLRLVFEGVDYYAHVWCNGHYLGSHEGHFAPFAFAVDGLLQPENVLTVRVTSPWDRVRRRGLTYVDEVFRGMVKGLYEHADGLIPPDVNPIGIWRPVWLEEHADITIERVTFAVEEDEFDHSAWLTLRLHVNNRRRVVVNGVLHIYLAGETIPGVRVDDHYPAEVFPGEQVIEQRVRIADPHWWWPWDMGHPDLYRLRCTLFDDKERLDAHEQVLGIRQVRLFRTRQSLHYQINNTPLFVRGTNYLGSLYLSQLTPERIAADLDRVQECGLNLIRLHVHVAPPELYDECDRRGILIWQDFELNWLHDPSPAFEERAVHLLREMVNSLHRHPSLITWSCHNEPSALPFYDHHLGHLDRRLYQEITALDPSRPAFLCSGRQEDDWLHSGDSHLYIGGAHGGHYLDVYGRRVRLVTEFGCEAPPAVETLDEMPLLRDRLAHLREHIAGLQAYQAALVRYQVEWYRLTRYAPCGGYIHFMFADPYPQVGCGVLDSARRPKAAYQALKAASQPVHVMMEYTAAGPLAIWVVNDLARPLVGCLVEWQVLDGEGKTVTRGSAQVDVPAQRAHRIARLSWHVDPKTAYTVLLRLSQRGKVLDENRYEDPFHPLPRPDGYPWRFDHVLGMRCYGGPHAQSSLRVLNTWYGKLAAWLFPVYDWAEDMLTGRSSPPLYPLIKKLLARV